MKCPDRRFTVMNTLLVNTRLLNVEAGNCNHQYGMVLRSSLVSQAFTFLDSAIFNAKKASVLETKRQCMESIHQEAYKAPTDDWIVRMADGYFEDIAKQISCCQSINELNAIEMQMIEKEEAYSRKIRASQR